MRICLGTVMPVTEMWARHSTRVLLKNAGGILLRWGCQKNVSRSCLRPNGGQAEFQEVSMACFSSTFQEPSSFSGGHILSPLGQIARPPEQLTAREPHEDVFEPEDWSTANGIIGSSPALRRILDQVKTVATTDSTVLIQGETGTGK